MTDRRTERRTDAARETITIAIGPIEIRIERP